VNEGSLFNYHRRKLIGRKRVEKETDHGYKLHSQPVS
jgi:hypothetical protein